MFKLILRTGKAHQTATGRVYYYPTSADARKTARRMGARGKSARIVQVDVKRKTSNKGTKAGHVIRKGKGKKQRSGKRKGRKAKPGRKSKRTSRRKSKRSGKSTWRHTPGAGVYFI